MRGPPESHHGPGVRIAMPLGQVPQVDRKLVEPVVAQVPMGQDAVKEGKAQEALSLQGLKQKREVTVWHWLGLGPDSGDAGLGQMPALPRASWRAS